MIIQEVVDEALKAFKETGLIPMRGDYYRSADEAGLEYDCACAIGAITESCLEGSGMSLVANSVTERELDREYGEEFATGLENGFDGDEPRYYNEAYTNGYDTGREIWQVLQNG